MNRIRKRKYTLNESALDVLTDEAAWVAGWLAADGCLTSGKQKVIVIALSEVDIDVLHKIKSFFGYAGPLRCLSSTPTYPTDHEHYSLAIGSGRLWWALHNLGILTRKSGRQPFPVAILKSGESKIRMFIRGYMEGNGAISITVNGQQPSVSFCGSHGMVTEIVNQLHRFAGVRRNTTRRHSQCPIVSEVKYKCHPAMKILDWIYASAGPYCDRKFRKYQEIKKCVGAKYATAKWLGEKLDGPRPVRQVSKIGGHMRTWPSLHAAAKAMGTSTNTIQRAADGIRKTAIGYKWSYA